LRRQIWLEAWRGGLEVEDEQSDVVLLGAGGVETGKCRNVGEQIVGKTTGGNIATRLQ